MHQIILGLTLSFILFLFDRTLAAPSNTLAKRTSRTSPPSGCLVVSTSGTTTGEFTTLQAAITALGTSTTAQCIFIYDGTYPEQITIDYPGPLTLYGYTADTSSYTSNTVTILSSQSSPEAGILDTSAAINVLSENFKIYNINFNNTYGEGAQAVAFTANGDMQGYYGCGFNGFQDTLYAKAGKQFYKKCYISGAVDFIFGDAAAWFGECTIAGGVLSYPFGTITANSREETSDTAWYVFDSSTITSVPGVSVVGEVALGRPWRVLARVIFQNSVLTDVVSAVGWTTLAVNATPIFEEWNNSGAGSDTTERIYETEATGAVSMTTLWGDDYADWIDETF